MDYSQPDSSVHDILQARIVEWVAVPFSRGSSQLRDRTQVAHIAGGFFTIWATREYLAPFKKNNFDWYVSMREQEKKGATEDEMVGLNGHEFEQTPGDSEGQGSLACCSPWGRKESDMT